MTTTYRIRITGEAEADLRSIYKGISERASAASARNYVDRILAYLASFDLFPERGSLRNEIRPGLRIVGFERRVSVAFVVEQEEVVFLRILYAGQEFKIGGGI